MSSKKAIRDFIIITIGTAIVSIAVYFFYLVLLNWKASMNLMTVFFSLSVLFLYHEITAGD